MYFKKIEGERVYLSPINKDDVLKYVEWMNDFRVTDGLNCSSKITTIESETEWLEKNSKNNSYQFAIVLKESNELIGNCGFHEYDSINGNATVGIFIGPIDYRGKGYGTESLKLLIDYGFNYLNLNNIMLQVYSFNVAAIKCYKKIGFKEIGKRRSCITMNNKKYDEIYMDILRSEYYDQI